MMKKHFTRFFALFLLLGISVLSNAQITNGTIAGTVRDAKGVALSGASVEAIHEPSGSKYKTVTSSAGKYNLPGLRVGGPYKVTVIYVGFTTETVTDLTVQLGDPSIVDFALTDGTKQLQEVTVAGIARKGALISKERKGTSTNINKRLLSSMPTLSRSITDFTKLTPQANGTSFAGQDNRAINFTLDGSIFNNSFGLQALNGSQTNSTPISLDAIEEIQINLSPYNLKESGFVGANINAVTKSGTNTVHGSGFYNQRNESYVGTKAGAKGEQDVVVSAFDVKQFGGSIGGAVIKNKLFYFVNYEGERRIDPGTSQLADVSNGTVPISGSTTRVFESDLIDVANTLSSVLKYNPGTYSGYTYNTKSDKGLAKIDWNINDKHKFSIRGNYLTSSRQIPINSTAVINGTRGSGTASMIYSNAGYIQNNDLYSVIGQLNSRLSNKVNNELIFGYTRNQDYRSFAGGSFPTVDIQKGGTTYISFGNDANSPNNILNTDTWQLSDNLTIYKGKHTLSTGFNYESFNYENGFTPQINGVYTFASVADFKTAANAYAANNSLTTSPVPLNFSFQYSNLPGGIPWIVKTKARNIGAYIQDDVELEKNFNLTYGVRFEVPYFVGSGYVNTEFDGFTFQNEKGESNKLSTSQLPSAKLMINPRIGFNYDVKGDKNTQIRGGAGLFTGRPQFVLISNQVGNNGVLSGSFTTGNTQSTLYPFKPTTPATSALYPPNPGVAAASYNVATTQNDFRFPQTFRANLAVDQKIYNDIVASAEFTFSQNISAIYYYNANFLPSTANFAGPDGRPRFGQTPNGSLNAATNTFGTITTPGTATNRIVSKITDVTVLKSGAYGGAVTATFKLEKPVKAKGLGWMIAYNFGSARDYASYSTTAAPNWTGIRSVNGNNKPDISFSDNDLRNRVITNVNYRIEFGNHAAFQVSLFSETKNWGRISYTYNGDRNGDGISGNDLLYVPRNQSEMKFETFAVGTVTYNEQQQKDAFDAYINQDKYLSTRRGQYAERNGALMPYVTRFDMSAVLELFSNIGKNRHTVQLRADIFNLGNLIDHNAGVGYVVNTSSPISFRGVDNLTGQSVYRVNTAVNNTINFNTYRKGTSVSDVYQAQFGVRYIF